METRAAPVLLAYRPWRGTLRGPWRGTLAIARTSLLLLLRRKLFWALYAVSAMVFLLFFYGQYLQSWLQTQIPDEPIPIMSVNDPARARPQTPARPEPGPRGAVAGAAREDGAHRGTVPPEAADQRARDESMRLGSGLLTANVRPKELIRTLKSTLHLDGSGYTFRNFINFESQIVMIVLALAGAILVGNDFRFGSIPFYLAKPLHRWHYLGGKFLAVGVFINLMTTVPALALFVEYGMIDSWDYYTSSARLLLGILGYGAVLTVTLGLLLLATATWLRRTMPLIMVWTAIFVFTRMLSDLLSRFDVRWRLLDLWNDLYLVGNWCLGMDPSTFRTLRQPAYGEAALVLAAVSLACVLYLNRRIQAVEIA
jgi:ABC-2 type transport system permease protein